MKKFQLLLFLPFLFKGIICGQTSGLTTYTSTIVPLKKNGFSCFAVDNNGVKWVGFNKNNNTLPNVWPQLLRFDGVNWDTLQHVPAGKVNALAVDASNHLWIGTDTGLVMYNGSSFTVFSTSNSSIASNTVISVACGGGNVYAGTYAGLCVFNGTSFSNYSHSSSGLSHDTIYSIGYESPSAVWLGNIQGLEKFYGSGFSFWYNLGGVGSDQVNCIYVDQQNNKWLGTSHYGVLRFDNLNIRTMQQLFGARPVQAGQIAFLMWPLYTNTICKGDNGGACFFSQGFGLIEIAANQVFCYQVPFGNLINQYACNLAYDYFSNFLYVADVNSETNQYFPFLLRKFDQSLYYNNSLSNMTFLDINEVQGKMLGNSDYGWDLSNSQYSVPKDLGNSPLFTASMWMGGYKGGTLHEAAMTYRQNGLDFWTGPLDTLSDSSGTTPLINPNTPVNDPVWKINRYDVANFIYNWNHGNVQNGTYIPKPNFISWPGNGSGNYAHDLAPYVDVNSNGIYDPLQGGDYPLIKGDQMLWWVFNDKAFTHGESGGTPLGVEVHASAYAFICPNVVDSNRVLNYTSFYNYKIFNRSNNQYDSANIGLWMDTDLGNNSDDYIGCDVMNNYGYTYNGDDYDSDYAGIVGYHNDLPAFACNVLNGPPANPGDHIDNNNNGIIDEPNENCLMGYFGFFLNTGDSQIGNPMGLHPNQYANFMRGYWRNGSKWKYGGYGTNSSNVVCRHLFPGTSDPYGISMGGSISNPIPPQAPYNTTTGWTCQSGGLLPSDMRFQIGVGPFTMLPHGVYDIDYALVFSQDSAQCVNASHLCILPRAQQDNIRVRNWFAANNFPSCLNLSGLSVKENSLATGNVSVYPNPAEQYVTIEFNSSVEKVTVELLDMVGNTVKAGIFNATERFISIPVNDLSQGVYILKIQSERGWVSKRFVKQ